MSKKYIKISTGNFEYTPIDLANKKEKFNVQISRKILLDFKKIMDKNGIFFGLIYGTLLGCIREGDLIKDDLDIDVFMLDKDRKRFLETLPILLENNLPVCRYESDLLSLIREGNHLDIYFFKQHSNLMKCGGKLVLEPRFLLETKKHSFYRWSEGGGAEEEFNVPKDHVCLLESLYGKHWRVPMSSFEGNYSLQQIQFYQKTYSYLGLILRKVENINKTYNSIILYGNGTLTKILSKFLTIEYKIADIATLQDNQLLINPKNIDKYQYQAIFITLLGREDEVIDTLIKCNISLKKVRRFCF